MDKQINNNIGLTIEEGKENEWKADQASKVINT